MTQETPPNPELSEEQLLAQVRSWVKNSFPKNYPNREIEIEHLLRTEHWVRQIESKADIALRIAALTHDIERAFPASKFPPHPKSGYTQEEYRRYQIKHSNRSARITGNLLKGLGVPEEQVRNVRHLIRAHEVGGTPRFNLLQAADSISFLEVKAPLFISWIPEERTWQEVKDKIDLMYNRIYTRRAKEMVGEPYKEAMRGLEERRQQIWREYRRLVKKCEFSDWPSEEEIEALREAGDRVLSLG